MNWFAILTASLLDVESVRQLDTNYVARLQSANNPKAERIRLLDTGTRPTPGSNQVVVFAGWEITESTATQQWALRGKTTEEAQAETRTRDRDELISAAISRIERDIPRLETAITNFDTLTTAQRWAAMKELLKLVQLMARIQRAQLLDELNP